MCVKKETLPSLNGALSPDWITSARIPENVFSLSLREQEHKGHGLLNKYSIAVITDGI